MRGYTRVFLLAVFLLGVLVASPTAAMAAEFWTAGEVTVPAGTTLRDDLYAMGGTVRVLGTVAGDLVAFAGNVEVEGSVEGDVVALGGSLVVKGLVLDDLRVAGGTVEVMGVVEGDAIAAGGTVKLAPGGSVRGDMVAAGGQVELAGEVGGDVTAASGTLRLAGPVGGDVSARVQNKLEVADTARIKGSLTYVGRREATIPAGAVAGPVEREVPTIQVFVVRLEDTAAGRAVRAIVGAVQRFLALLLIGGALLWALPRALDSARRTLAVSPWRSLGLGVLTLVALPLVVGVVAGVAVFIAGWGALPLALVPGAVYLCLILLASIPVAFLLGGIGLRVWGRPARPSPLADLAAGAAILALVGLVPVLNSAVGALTLLFGFGAWSLYLWRTYRDARREGRA